jgi:hypothetical protein
VALKITCLIYFFHSLAAKKVEQPATNESIQPQDAVASLLHRLGRCFYLPSGDTRGTRHIAFGRTRRPSLLLGNTCAGDHGLIFSVQGADGNCIWFAPRMGKKCSDKQPGAR